ncbi:MAG: MFS transporter [Alphaproteobacteria bacterium]
MSAPPADEPRRFAHIAIAGVTFQAGSTAVDSSTIMAALVHQLTGSPLAVGAVTAVLRFGWLLPQLIVGFWAERRGSSLRYYIIGGFGRAFCLLALAMTLFLGSDLDAGTLGALALLLWTAYAFVSGIVAVPYNDIVARSVSSHRRSRLLATRFFGGGVLALGVAAIADLLVDGMPFPTSYAAIIGMAAGLMLISSGTFVEVGEPRSTGPAKRRTSFGDYLGEGAKTFRRDRRFRLFVLAQWAGGAVLMAMPFYVVQASAAGFAMADVAWLLGAQTAGALASNPLWGWWGDRLGKSSLLQAVALGRILPPCLILALVSTAGLPATVFFNALLVLFFVLGALANGLTIAVIGFLMEISPEDRRPSYSGYFNALTAPAFLLPLLGGALVASVGLSPVFLISLAAALLQFILVSRVRQTHGLSPKLGAGEGEL